jgi:hypothetical protein
MHSKLVRRPYLIFTASHNPGAQSKSKDRVPFSRNHSIQGIERLRAVAFGFQIEQGLI